MSDTYTIEELNQGFKEMISHNKTLNDIQVIGEISNFKITRNNLYFTIKDNVASLSAVCWNFSNKFNININNGDKIILGGQISISKINNLQIIVSSFQKVNDTGDMYKEYIKLKEYFEQMGYFNNEHKKLLPKYTNNIGIITALNGAALQDILYVLKTKGFNGTVHIKGCVVQGDNCEKSVAQSIQYLDDFDLDVIIVARGGGSYEDLYGFSKKKIIKAIYDAKTCIISAIGHEVDSMLSDFVADIRAPTPSIAGEIIVSNQQSNYRIDIYRNYLKELYYKIKLVTNNLSNKIIQLENNLSDPIVLINNRNNIYKKYLADMYNTIKTRLYKYDQLFDKYDLLENSKNKNNTMKNGYVQLYNGTINISSIEQLLKLQKRHIGGKKLKLKLSDGTVNICLSNIEINGNTK